MCASPRSAIWPQLVAISLIGLGVASCSADSGRFGEGFGSSSPPAVAQRRYRFDPQTAPASHIESRPLPHLASADDGTSGGGRGMGSYQPGKAKSPARFRPRRRRRPGPGKAVRRSRRRPARRRKRSRARHSVPVAALMEANNITSPAMVHPGQHLVIPRYRSATAASPPHAHRLDRAARCRRRSGRRAARWLRRPACMSWRPAKRSTASRGSTASRSWCWPRPTIFRPTRWCKVGDRIIIPEMREAPRPAPVAPRAEAPVAPRRSGTPVATIESPHSARLAAPSAPRGRGQFGQGRRARRQSAELPLAGARPHHRRLRTEAERLAERRHQSRGAGRHADQGGRGRRRRLCRQRAQGLWQSGAGAPRQRLRHRLRPCQRNPGQARRERQTRPGDRAIPARPAM